MGFQVLVLEQFLATSVEGDAAVFEHVASISHLQGLLHVLLDE